MICSLNKLVHLEKKRVNSEMYIDVINMREMNRVTPLYAPKICTTALWKCNLIMFTHLWKNEIDFWFINIELLILDTYRKCTNSRTASLNIHTRVMRSKKRACMLACHIYPNGWSFEIFFSRMAPSILRFNWNTLNICLNNGDSVIAKYLNRMKVRGSGRKYNYGLSKVI